MSSDNEELLRLQTKADVKGPSCHQGKDALLKETLCRNQQREPSWWRTKEEGSFKRRRDERPWERRSANDPSSSRRAIPHLPFNRGSMVRWRSPSAGSSSSGNLQAS